MMKNKAIKNLNDAIEKCRKGDNDAIKYIYEKFYGKMMTVCLRYSKNKDNAKDILHDAFLKVFDNIKKYNFKGSFEGWIRRIMVNTAIDYYRKNKGVFYFENEVWEQQESDKKEDYPMNDYLKKITISDIIEAMQELTPGYKVVFNLFAIEGYAHKEIAKMLNISEGTSKSNYAKAKHNLKKILEKKLK